MNTIERISLKKILMEGHINTKRDVEKELSLLKKNFEKNIEKKFNWALAYFYFSLCLFSIVYLLPSMTPDMPSLLGQLTLYLVIYPLIWLSQIQKNRKLCLVKKVQKASECQWWCIFCTILYLMLGLIRFIIDKTNFKTEINIWYLYGIGSLIAVLVTFGIKIISTKLAKNYDPEWFE